MAASPSSSGAAGQVAVWLYDANRNRVALVDVPTPLPALIQYPAGGPFYLWQHPNLGYQVASPFTPTADLGAPQASVVADPPPMQL